MKALAMAMALASAHAEPRAYVLDDGERIARDADRALAPEPWPLRQVDLFAMRGETIAVQVVVEAGDGEARGVYATLGALASADGTRLDADVEMFAERFIEIKRASGSEAEDASGSLAFTARAAPTGYVGWMADALVPMDVAGDLSIAPRTRGAIWIDVRIPRDARADVYRGAILVRDADGEIAARSISVRVLDREMPYAAAKTMVYYDERELARRIGDGDLAEQELRRLLHAHSLSAIHPVTSPLTALDREALSGEAFTPAHGYRGPGEGIGEGVLAIGAYGALDAPSAEGIAKVNAIAKSIPSPAQTFVYAVDEECDSPWGAQWLALVRRNDQLRGARVGVTCGNDPLSQAADLVMLTSEDLVPARARAARHEKWVWAYNGRRPFAGPLMLDVPATDLRANAWIAARYGIERWFYWESTFWFDSNRGGRGGENGFDPYVVAETFHNADGDWANGDGILVYPGAQRVTGMVDYGRATVFPSVRLKNLRRGIEDAGYITLAREGDAAAADAIVRRMIPRALALADARAAWPERGAAWLDARRDLAVLIERSRLPRREAMHPAPASNATRVSSMGEDAARDVRPMDSMSDGCAVKSRGRAREETSALWQIALLMFLALGRRLGSEPRMKLRKRYTPPPGKTPRHLGPDSSKSASKSTTSEAETVPPPAMERSERNRSGVRARKSQQPPAAATVDEVTADLSKDPRRED